MKSVLTANKKGNLGGLFGDTFNLILVVLLLGAGLLALGQFKSAMTASSAEANATASGITAIGTIANTWLTVVVSVIMAGLVIYILVRSFSGNKK